MNANGCKKWVPLLVFVAAIAVESLACSVPVFRYALERWERDEYRLIIAAPGKLAPEYQARVDELETNSYHGEGFCNLSVTVVDISDAANQGALQAFPAMAKVTEPTAFLLYPAGSYIQTVIHQEPFRDELVEKVLSSAFVEEVTLEILRGTSAVWVLVDSGNQEADDAAYNALTETLAHLDDQIEMPEGLVETSGSITGGLTEEEVLANFDPANILRSGIPLKIGFAVKRLTKDQAEPVFRAILMHCEEDMKNYMDQPMAFPVFGRGRFLVPLIGEEINGDNIGMASMYVCGICSCQVKSGNPGIDLLSHVDWYSYLVGSEVVQDRELPPLTGTSELTETAEAPVAELELAPLPDSSSPLRRNLTVMIGVVLGVVVGVSLKIAKKR